MRIAIVVGIFPTLSETFILNQITGLIDRQHEIDIYALKQGNSLQVHADILRYRLYDRTYYYQGNTPSSKSASILDSADSVSLSELISTGLLETARNLGSFVPGLNNLPLLHAFVTQHRKKRYDIVHCHFGPTGLCIAAFRKMGIFQGKFITTFHGVDASAIPSQLGANAYAPLFDKGDLFLPVSNYFKQRLKKLGCDERRLLVHHMGVDCNTFSYGPRPLLNDGQIKLLTVGRLVEKKGIEYGIRAVARLAKVNNRLVYHIIGDGPLKAHLSQLINSLGVGDRVKLLGPKKYQEIPAVYHDTDILLAPSITAENGDQEGIPVVLMEAMASGLPVVTTQHSGISELVEDGVSGFLVPEYDIDALAEKLQYLIDNPRVWPDMGRAGRIQVEEHFNNEKLNDRLVNIYRRLLSDASFTDPDFD
jgi:colanic acid/amylovoran biosynthesis glycosyltransferase